MELNAIMKNSSLPNPLSITGAFNAKKFASEEHVKVSIFATNSTGRRLYCFVARILAKLCSKVAFLVLQLILCVTFSELVNTFAKA